MKRSTVAKKEQACGSFYLEDWLVEPSLDRIKLADEVQKLEPRVMAVLVYLANRQGRLVSREELEYDVWRGALVGYDAVTGTIIKLRKALKDKARQPHYIETIPKRGYRLIAAVTFVSDGHESTDKVALKAHPDDRDAAEPVPGAEGVGDVQAPEPSDELRLIEVSAGERTPAVGGNKLRFLLGAAGLLLLGAVVYVNLPDTGQLTNEGALKLPDRPSLAVLPFENLSDDQANDYFSDGMTDDLITDLSRLPGLFLISRYSSFSYKQRAIDPRKVGSELGVRYLVVGSVRRVGETLRVNAQLVDALQGEQLWAERFDTQATDVFAVQDQINASILEALSLKLTDAQNQRSSDPPTKSPAAYDAYLKGMSHFWRATADDYGLAVGYLEQAIELDLDYTDAYAALAAVYWQAYKRGWNRNQPWVGLFWDKTMDALDKALKRPSALAYFVDSGVYTTNQRHEQAVEQARLAVQKFPNDAYAHLALADALSFSGESGEAKLSAEQGLRLDPRRPEPYLFALGRAHFEMGEMEEAVVTLKKAVHDNGTDVLPRVLLVSALGHLGHMDEARRQLDQLNELYKKNRLRRLNLRDFGAAWPYRAEEDMARIQEGLRKLGVPEW